MTDTELKALYVKYGALVRRRCDAILRQPAEAEDALQNVFLRVRRYGAPRGQPITLAWLYTVANHVCFDLMKKTRREDATDPAGIVKLRAASGRTSDEGFEASATVRRMVSRVDPKTREIGLLHHLGGLSQEEVAARTGYSRKTVGRKLAVFEALVRGYWRGESDVT